MPLRINHLPLLVIVIVLRELEPIQLFDYSLLSKRCYRTVKLVKTKNRLELSVDIAHNIFVTLSGVDYENYDEWYFQVPHPMNIWYTEREGFRFFTGNTYLNLYKNQEDQLEKFKSLVIYIMDIFEIKEINAIEVNICKNACAALDWIHNRQETIKNGTFNMYNFKIYDNCTRDTEHPIDRQSISNILDRIGQKYTTLEIHMEENLDFIQNDFRIYEYNYLELDHGYWVTLPKLLTMNIKELMIYQSRLTSRDLNTFFKFWLAGSHYKMRFFMVTIQELRVELMDRIPFTVVDPEEVRYYTNATGYSYRYSGPRNMEIVRGDGTTAWIQLTRNYGRVTIQFQVWEEP